MPPTLHNTQTIPQWIFAIFFFLPVFSSAQHNFRPIIDMHLHGYTAEEYYGGSPNPANGIASPENVEEFRQSIIELMDRHNIEYAVMSASPEALETFTALDDRFIPAAQDQNGLIEITKFERLVKEGKIRIFGEIMAVYKGLSLSDPVYAPYLAICEKYDIPVAVHTGTSHPRLAATCCPGYRIEKGNPLHVEEVLVRHPDLRLYLMHAGTEHYQEALVMMYQFPQLYVDLGALLWIDDFTKHYGVEFLKAAKSTGMIDRVMFGSDAMVWPGGITKSIEFLESLDFLSEEDKRNIFYHNAARFLKLKSDE